MTVSKKVPSRAYLLTGAVMLFLIILSRASTFLYTVTATDVAYPDWIPNVLSYVTPAFRATRLTLGFVFIAKIYFKTEKFISPAMLAIGASLTEYIICFVIDYLRNAITQRVGAAILSLSVQFVYDIITVLIALLVCNIILKKRQRAETSHDILKYTDMFSAKISLLIVFAIELALEAYNIFDFVITYSDITSAEIASMTVAVIKIVIIYLLIPQLCSELFGAILKKHVNSVD